MCLMKETAIYFVNLQKILKLFLFIFISVEELKREKRNSGSTKQMPLSLHHNCCYSFFF